MTVTSRHFVEKMIRFGGENEVSIYPKYKQILPADGWVMVFFRGQPDKAGLHFDAVPVTVWVLCEDGDGSTFVAGLDAEDLPDGYHSWQSELFVCYARRSEVEANPERFNAQARQRRELRRQLDQVPR